MYFYQFRVRRKRTSFKNSSRLCATKIILILYRQTHNLRTVLLTYLGGGKIPWLWRTAIVLQIEENGMEELVRCQEGILILCLSNVFLARAVFGNDLADLEGPGTPKYLHEWYAIIALGHAYTCMKLVLHRWWYYGLNFYRAFGVVLLASGMIIFCTMGSKHGVYFGNPARTTSLRHALIPPALSSHLDANISSCNLCDSSLCLFGCAQKLRDMYDREETFDLATEVGGTGESSVHCVASLLKVWRAHAKCLCFIGIENDNRILSWLKVGP